MKVNNSKINELKETSAERALNEGYILATEGIKVEDLKLFQFENGESDFIIADNLDNAIGCYIEMVGKMKLNTMKYQRFQTGITYH